MATDDVPTTLTTPDTPEILDALDGWEVELVFDARPERAQPLATVAMPSAAANDAPLVTPAPAAAAHNLVQMAVFPTVQETPASCVRLLAASLIGLGTLLAAGALFGGR